MYMRRVNDGELYATTTGINGFFFSPPNPLVNVHDDREVKPPPPRVHNVTVSRLRRMKLSSLVCSRRAGRRVRMTEQDLCARSFTRALAYTRVRGGAEGRERRRTVIVKKKKRPENGNR